MHPLFRTQSDEMAERGRSRKPRQLSENSLESYESAEYSFDSDDSDSYEQVGDESQYETDGSDASSSDVSGDDLMPMNHDYESDEYEDNNLGNRFNPADYSSASESIDDEFDDEDRYGNEINNENDYNDDDDDDDEWDDEDENEYDDDINDKDEDDNDDQDRDLELGEQNDSLFWKRYGYSQKADGLSNSHIDPNTYRGDDDDDSPDDDDDFDDGDTFKDELYKQSFPSIGLRSQIDNDVTPEKNKASTNDGGGYVAKFTSCFNTSCFNCDRMKNFFDNVNLDFLTGKYRWYIIGGVIFLLIVIVAIVIAVLVQSDDPPTTAPEPPISTLPPGVVSDPITFFGLIEDGKEYNFTVASLEEDFSIAISALALQVLNETKSNATKNDETTMEVAEEKKERSNNSRHRKLEFISVEVPVPVDVLKIVCPNGLPNSEQDLCVQATADIVLITEDGDIADEYIIALEEAIEGGQLQDSLQNTGSNITLTVVVIEKDVPSQSPTITPFPTVSPGPTFSPAPTPSCFDKEKNCQDWASQEPSQCDTNPDYMNFFCAQSCGLCESTPPPTATITTPSPTASSPVITPSPSGISTSISFTNSPEILPLPTTSPSYNDISDAPAPTENPIQLLCFDENERCSEWASDKECESNPDYMLQSCKASCGLCEDPTPIPCVDENERCEEWSLNGECESNPDYMFQSCKASCGLCEDPISAPCFDENEQCNDWSLSGECESNPEYMLQSCKASCGLCQDPIPIPCADENERCEEWSLDGECESNPDYMLQSCKASCGLCENPTHTPCVDENERCEEWSLDGECESNPDYMLESCKASCGQC